MALLNFETSISIQKRHSYTRNLNSETSGDSKNAFLHCGDVLDNSNDCSDDIVYVYIYTAVQHILREGQAIAMTTGHGNPEGPEKSINYIQGLN